ncbi:MULTISPECIES: hypothetical protein [Sorangium]|uniref:Secreted protein n=1 Tax=Sorangium cellulosum TaxID=56 RepID=A0A4P2QMV7_SORCE|nr:MULTISPECIES: hypothetical protein [Sorangium]AUX31427.1 hypothetical protein SOCE836_035560 [Sorangium cellulosum]WCQ90808.1 hypothetical protein NQZ70_03520 [Sorangium sp. Soce836]
MRSFTLLTWLLLAPALAPARAAAAPPAPSQGAAAAASRVVIVEADADDPLVREAATRLRAELGAAGFEVVRVPGRREGDARAALERAALDEGAFAAAAIFRSGAGATADLWIVDRVTQKTVVRTVEVSGAAAPSVMAVRAVELLQASLLEASLLSSRAPPEGAAGGARAAVPEDVQRWMAPVRRQAGAEPAAERPGLLAGFGVEAGLAALLGAGGIGPALGPALRLSYGAGGGGGALPAGLAARLTFAGPALGPALEGALGAVSVRQEMALLEAVWAPETGAAISPVLSAGVGAVHLFIAGDPLPPLRSATGEVWSIAASLGGGAGLRLTDRAALLLDAHAIFAEPRAVVTLGGERLGTAGRPTFAGFLGLLVRL